MKEKQQNCPQTENKWVKTDEFSRGNPPNPNFEFSSPSLSYFSSFRHRCQLQTHFLFNSFLLLFFYIDEDSNSMQTDTSVQQPKSTRVRLEFSTSVYDKHSKSTITKTMNNNNSTTSSKFASSSSSQASSCGNAVLTNREPRRLVNQLIKFISRIKC